MAPGPPAGSQSNGPWAAPGDQLAYPGLEPDGPPDETLVGVFQSPGALSSPVRVMGEKDLRWLDYLCLKRYSHRYDQEGTEIWFLNTVLKSPILFYPIRTDNAFTITMLSCVPWLPLEWNADVVFTCADETSTNAQPIWEVIRLLRRSIEWSRKRNVAWWRISSDTEYNIAPLARRIGADKISSRFCLRLC